MKSRFGFVGACFSEGAAKLFRGSSYAEEEEEEEEEYEASVEGGKSFIAL